MIAKLADEQTRATRAGDATATASAAQQCPAVPLSLCVVRANMFARNAKHRND